MLDLYKLSKKVLNQERVFKYNFILAPLEHLIFRFITLNSVNQFKMAYKVYRESGLVPKNIASVIIMANFKTKGSIRNQILVTKVRTNPPPSSIFSEGEITNALADLRRTGFGKLGVIRDPKVLSELLLLETAPVYSGQRYKTSGRSEIELQNSPDIESDHIWYVEPETALENVALQKIISDPFWKYISDNYLGSETHLSAIRCWHSFPPQRKEFLSPENWHLDAADGLNFIKFFLLLTDVDMKSGPTAIVPVPSSKLPRKFYTGRRYTDQEVNKLLNRNKKNILNATGSKGLIYVADTRLLHKGTPVVEGHRFILNWVSSVDSFGTVQSEKYKLKDNNLLKNRNDLLDI